MASLPKTSAAWPTPMVPVHEIMSGDICMGCGTALELRWMIDSGLYEECSASLGKIIAHEPAAFDKQRDERRRADMAK